MSSPASSDDLNSYGNRLTAELRAEERNQPIFKRPKDDVELDLESIVFGGSNVEEFHRSVQAARNLALDPPANRDLGHETDPGNVGNASDESDEEGGLLDFFLSTEPVGAKKGELAVKANDNIPAKEVPGKLMSGWPNDKSNGGQVPVEEPKAAWVDEDDDDEEIGLLDNNRLKKLRTEEGENLVSGTDYQKRLRTQHANIHAPATWADVEGYDVEAEEDLRAFRRVGELWTKQLLAYDRCSDLTRSVQLKGHVRHLEFHPAGEVVLASGPSDPITLIRADGEHNKLLRRISLQGFPITSATFASFGDEIIATSTSAQFYAIDVESGVAKRSHLAKARHKGGFDLGGTVSPNSTYLALMSSFNSGVHLASARTKMMIGTVRLPTGTPRAAVFDNEERYLYTLAESGEVFVFDPRAMRCVKRFQDYGGFKASSLAISPDGAYLSIGSKSGIVNLYNLGEINSPTPTPFKEVPNLTTSIDALTFNHDSQLLGFFSSERKDKVKLLHVPSRRVVANWPPSHMGLKRCTSMAFSPNSGYLALGNSGGQIPLFRLNPYPLA
ncbi:U3 snoRNP protein [Massospora cicadina]|nr:U3 snoRNP protein [Massospora cicadina]